MARLQTTVARLKASRDKLLAEVDAQSVEIERLSHEATALAAVCGSAHARQTHILP